MSEAQREPEMDSRDREVLAAARHRRMGVQAAMADLESALASPSTGREAAWSGQVVGAVQRLQAAFRHHVEVTESDDGLFADVIAQAPRLSHQVAQLQADHPKIDEQLTSLAERVGAADPAAITDDVLAVLGQIVRHRHAGASLVYEAYNVDIEAGD